MGINNGLIGSLSAADVGFTSGNASLRFNPGGLTEHRQDDSHWTFRSSIADTTFSVRNRLRFDTDNENFYTGIHIPMNGMMNFVVKDFEKFSNVISHNYGATNFTLNGTFTTGINYDRKFTLTSNVMSFTVNEGSTTKTEFRVSHTGFNYATQKIYFLTDDQRIQYKLNSDSFGVYFTYNIDNKILQVRNTIQLMPNDNLEAPAISVTNNKDIRFTRNALPYKTITLTEIMQKGEIIAQETEPVIPDNSFAFWVNGSTFYLILRSGGVQKKIQFD